MITPEQASETWRQVREKFRDGDLTEYKLGVLVGQFDGLMLDGDVRAAAMLYLVLFSYSRWAPLTVAGMVTQFDSIGRFVFTDTTRRYEPVVVRVARGIVSDIATLDEVLREVEQAVSLSPAMRDVRALQRTCEDLRLSSEDANVRWVCKRVCKPGLVSVSRAAVEEHALVDVPVLVRKHVPAAVDEVLRVFAETLAVPLS